MGFIETRDLASLPDEIEALEVEQAAILERIAEPAFYRLPVGETAPVHARLAEIESELEEKYARWEALEGLRDQA